MNSAVNNQTQICKNCTIPKAFDAFRRSRNKTTGEETYSPTCKACVKTFAEAKEAESALLDIARVVKSQVCTTCFVEKPLEEYYRRTAGMHGRDTRCKICTSEYNKQLRNGENKEELACRHRTHFLRINAYNRENVHIIYSEEVLSRLRTCNICREEMPLSKFVRDIATTGGFKHECKLCTVNLWKHRYATEEEFREKHKAGVSRYRATDHGKAVNRIWWLKNQRDIYDKYNAWSKVAKRWLTHSGGERSARLHDATPKWTTPQDRRLLQAITRKRKALEKETGIKHHADHRVPIRGDNVSGLHVWWNVEPIPAKINGPKSNKFFPELGLAQSQLDLKPYGLEIKYDPVRGFNSLVLR